MKRIFLLSTLLFLALPAFAWQGEDLFASFARLLSPEKVYLQTDREVYAVGDTVWFKGYLENAARTAEFPVGNYIYVELISTMVQKNVVLSKNEETEQVRVRVKVKRRDDGFSGWLAIPDNLNTGIATLRAYSYWMLNREPEYMFHKDLELRNPMKDDFVETLVRDNIKDDYKYHDVGMRNPFDKQRPRKAVLDLQFLPESGRWLYGQQSVLGIRAVDPDGHGVALSGEIFADDQPVGRFETDRHGLGRALVQLEVPPKKLFARYDDGDLFVGEADVPKPEQAGASIRLTVRDDSVEATLFDQGLSLPESTSVVVHDRDGIYVKIPYTEQAHRLRIPYALLAPGINNLAIVDDQGTVYAQRAFFVYPEKTTAELAFDKVEYGPRERVVASVDLPEGDWSVAVTDNSYAPYSGQGYDLVSWWYLGSELPSFVEEAQRLFNEQVPQAERIADMDAVMLTHGWTYYELPDILTGHTEMPRFGKEYTQSLSGVVKGAFRTARRSMVSFVAPSLGFSAIGQLDTTGYFVLNGIDFPEGTQFLVSAESLGGNTRRFTPYLDDDIFARFHHYPAYLDKPSYSQEYKYDILKDYYNAGGDIVYSLHPSYVTGMPSPKQQNISPLPDYEFKPGQYRSEQDLEPYKALDVHTYIVSTCPPLRFAEGIDSVDDNNGSYRSIVCKTQKVSTQMGISSGWEEIIVYLDGMRSSCEDIEGLNVSDLTGFAYLTGSDASRFNTGMDNVLAPKSVILLKSRMYVHDIAVNVSSGKPLGWQQPKHFYNPRYEDPQLRRHAPETVRPTLYWNSNLIADPEGKTLFDFYTSEHKSDCTVILEGFSKEGYPLTVKATVRR